MSRKAPSDQYWVENDAQRIGPYKKLKKAAVRVAYEQTVRGESGAGGKEPEMTMRPKGVAGSPDFQNLPRVSPKAPAGNGRQSRGYDYTTGREVRNDTAAQRKMKPRGYQGK